jgi:hypothetical protein
MLAAKSFLTAKTDKEHFKLEENHKSYFEKAHQSRYDKIPACVPISCFAHLEVKLLDSYFCSSH